MIDQKRIKQERMNMNCPEPDCEGRLGKPLVDLAEGVWECDTCRSRWHIIKTSDGKTRKKPKYESGNRTG